MLAIYLQQIETSEARTDFEVFYYQYRKLMYYIAFDIVNDGHLAEDVVSETFMSLARNFAFIRTLGPISCPQIKRYVVISVKHTAFNMLKKEKRHSGLSLDDIETEWIAEENCVLDTIIENEEIEKARKAIEELPEIYREACSCI